MPHHILTLDSLGLLDDGKPAAAFDKALKAAVLDCLDRPYEDKPRKVTMEFCLTPVPNEDRVKLQIFFTPKMPPLRTREYDCGTKTSGGLVFNEDSPENVDQKTFLPGREKDGDR